MNVLVFGGTGYVGREVVRRLAAAGDEVVFTWHSDAATAAALPGLGVQVDLSEPGAAAGFLQALEDEQFNIEGMVHCARLRPDGADEADQLERALRLGAEATRAGLRGLASSSGPAIRNAVLLTAWAPGQSLPLPAPAAAAQGAMVTLAMAMGRELAGAGVRVNAISLGLLAGGAASAVSADQVESYNRLSALHRVGTAAEIASTVIWLLKENRILNGKVLASNGGI